MIYIVSRFILKVEVSDNNWLEFAGKTHMKMKVKKIKEIRMNKKI